jgi:uncharacterized PurR-regulated membrane protein YhhQ (DUF165 family)
MLKYLFGECESNHGRISLPIFFCIILTSTTLFFYDHMTIVLFRHNIHVSVGLIFFPFTFTITNIMQYKYGKIFANTAVRFSFIGDVLLVSIAFLLSSIGEREDYFSVYKEVPSIMIMTFFFVWLSNFINIKLFSSLENNTSNFFRFFISSSVSEVSISCISIPMMFFKNSLTDNLIISILFISAYKIIVTMVLSLIISFQIMKNNRHQVLSHSQS